MPKNELCTREDERNRFGIGDTRIHYHEDLTKEEAEKLR